MVFSFLMINPLFIKLTIWRGKLNKQIRRVKVDCAWGMAEEISALTGHGGAEMIY
jgi:hypothetical protein